MLTVLNFRLGTPRLYPLRQVGRFIIVPLFRTSAEIKTNK